MVKYDKIGRTSSEAVKKATGKNWGEWIAILDKEGANKMVHKDIAELLFEKYLKNGWWCQSVTVGYEKARWLRADHQKSDGFEASASKTVALPVQRLLISFLMNIKIKLLPKLLLNQFA